MMNYSLGTLTSGSFKEKLELIELICYLTFQLREKDSSKYKNTKDVLEELFGKTFTVGNGKDDYFINLSLLCDDLLYQVITVNKPDKYKDLDKVGNIIAQRIREITDQWCPF